MDDEDDVLNALQAKITVLELETAGLKQALAAVAASLSCESPEAARRTLVLLTLTSVCARLQDDPPTNFAIDEIIDRLLALTAEKQNPEALLLVRAQLALDAGPSRRNALARWIAQASAGELAEEVRELLQRLLGPLPALRPGAGSEGTGE